MKKIFTISICVITAVVTTLNAQPTFTSATIPTPGTIITFYDVNHNGIVQGSAGANQTWNFASYTPNGTTFINQYALPSSTPFGASFTSSNLAVIAPATTGSNGYTYFSTSSSQVDIIGLAVQGTPNIVYNFSNPRKLLVFPLTYNTTFTDTYTAFASYTVNGIVINQYQYGNVSFLADAWGTITTAAGGPYTNCLRTRTINHAVDSSVYVGVPIPASVTVQDITTYNWSKNSSFETVLNISYATVNTIGGIFVDTTVHYSTLFTGVNELNSDLRPFEVYPNPAVNSSVINMKVDELNSGATKFIATDLQGKVVKQFDFELGNANHKHVSVDIADLPSGLYFIRLEQPDARYITRFVKQ